MIESPDACIFVLTGDNRYYTLNNGSSSTFEPEDVDSDDELSDSEVHYVRPGRKNTQNTVTCPVFIFASQVGLTLSFMNIHAELHPL